MIDEDITSEFRNDKPDVKSATPDEIYTKNLPDKEPRRRSNPTKVISLLVAGCIILVLCLCCCSSIFTSSINLDEQVENLCALLKTEGQTDPFGFCK